MVVYNSNRRITNHKKGFDMNNILTGDAIDTYRLRVLLKGLELECKGFGMSRGQSCYQVIKAEFGFKGSKQKVLEQFRAMLAKA